MLNKFPLWKNITLIIILILAAIYALPNLYGEDPSVQVTGNNSSAIVNTQLENKIEVEKMRIDKKIVFIIF